MNIGLSVKPLFDWFLGNDETIEFPLSRILEGDVISDGEFEVEVLAIEASPFLRCPEEWTDYGNDGLWAYCDVLSHGGTAWVPVDALVKATLAA